MNQNNISACVVYKVLEDLQNALLSDESTLET